PAAMNRLPMHIFAGLPMISVSLRRGGKPCRRRRVAHDGPRLVGVCRPARTERTAMSDWISEVLTVQEQLRNETVFDDPMQRLLQEHRIIAALTSSLEVWSISAEEDDDIDVECADLLMSLLAEFVDEVHHK